MRDTVDGINEKAWERTMSREHKVYVLMWTEPGDDKSPREQAVFITATTRAAAIEQAKKVRADVYAIPSGQIWDCPKIRATFTPIYVSAKE